MRARTAHVVNRAPRAARHMVDAIMWPSTALEQAVPPVVLVMSAEIRPRIALWRASVFAKRMGARLFVVACLPDDKRVNMLFPHRHLAEAEKNINSEDAVRRRVWRWCNKKPVAPAAVMVGRGDLSACAASVATKLKAQLVVLSALDDVSGRDVTAIVEDAGVSVMLSRATRPRNAVIAATDMTLQDFPVVRKGVVVAELLGAPLTIVHNVEPQMPAQAVIAADGAMFLPLVPATEKAKARERRANRLRAVAARFGGVEAKVLEDVDTIGAILGFAKSQQADMVIVGHRRRSWLVRVFGKSVASNVINRSIRSIMVVPVAK